MWQKMMKKQRGLSAKFKRLNIGTNADPSMDKNTFLAERLLVAHDVGSAIGFLHSNRVIYRDIKPDNIGFDIRGDVKIFDFGVSNLFFMTESHGRIDSFLIHYMHYISWLKS